MSKVKVKKKKKICKKDIQEIMQEDIDRKDVWRTWKRSQIEMDYHGAISYKFRQGIKKI